MTRKLWTLPLVALGLAAAPAFAETAPVHPQKQEQASIAFANSGGIRDWRSDGRSTLYLQDRHGQWYKAELMIPSSDLPFAWAIGFDTGPVNRLDRFSSVVIDGRRYPIQSLVQVDGPPGSDRSERS